MPYCTDDTRTTTISTPTATDSTTKGNHANRVLISLEIVFYVIFFLLMNITNKTTSNYTINCYIKEPCNHDGPCDPQRPRVDCFRNITSTSDLTEEMCCKLRCCWDKTVDDMTRVCYRNVGK